MGRGKGGLMELCRQKEAKAELCTDFFAASASLQGETVTSYQWSLKPALMLLLLVASPTSVTAVVTCNGP